MIQDYIFTAGSWLFILALLPAVVAREKPARSTCALTSGVLYVFAATYVTLDLGLTAASTAATATIWLVLLLQKRPLDKATPV